MRFFKIFLLYFQVVFTERGHAFVFFLQSLLGPLTFFLYWRGAHFSHASNTWSLSNITSYYVLFAIVSTIIMCYPEYEISRIDIREGNLVSYLLRPFAYFGLRLFNILAHRAFEASMTFTLLILLIVFFGKFFSVVNTGGFIFLSIVISILGFFLTFVYKLLLGITTFWIIDNSGLFSVSEMLIFIFSGYIVPISLFPDYLQHIAYVLPFAYMVYFPVIAFQGHLSTVQFLQIIVIQLSWIVFLYVICQMVWKKGLRKFTGVGQ